jgi:DNA-directed RNA polymerase subunit M/transcription elongation factor TFIIS
MEFCAEYGSRLIPRKVNSGKQALVMLACTKCEFKKQESNDKLTVGERIFEHTPKQFVAVIGKERAIQCIAHAAY